jgi:hypothetical protein
VDSSITISVAYAGPFVAGDLIEIQGCVNDLMNTRAEILSVRGTFLTMRQASSWNLLRDHLRSAWLQFRWSIDDAYFELCDIWDEAKEDWRRIHEPS